MNAILFIISSAFMTSSQRDTKIARVSKASTTMLGMMIAIGVTQQLKLGHFAYRLHGDVVLAYVSIA